MPVINDMRSFQTSPKFQAYSKVHLDVSDTLWYESGDDSGRTLTLENPWGTQEMCDNILATVTGYAHQPFSSEGAYIDPSVELWDSVEVRGIQSRIGEMRSRMGTMLVSDLKNPGENAIDHEIPFKPKEDRKIMRELKDVRSTILVQAGLISAKVEKTGGGESFSWDMNETEQVWKANGSEVFRLDKDGAKVTGEIRATSGTIGGFTINSSSLTATGISISPSGITLGKNFKVDSSGNLTASSGTFSGSVYANMIKTGEKDGIDRGYISNSQLGTGCISSGKISASAVTTSKIQNLAIDSDKINQSIQDTLSNGQTAYNNMGKFLYAGKYYGVGLQSIPGYNYRFLIAVGV